MTRRRRAHYGHFDKARRVEDLGYSILFMADHLNHPLAPFSALTLAAEVTCGLRLGTYVLSNDYRHPTMLAKELATTLRLWTEPLVSMLRWNAADHDPHMESAPRIPRSSVVSTSLGHSHWRVTS